MLFFMWQHIAHEATCALPVANGVTVCWVVRHNSTSAMTIGCPTTSWLLPRCEDREGRWSVNECAHARKRSLRFFVVNNYVPWVLPCMWCFWAAHIFTYKCSAKKKMKKRTCTCVRSCALSLDLLISMDLWDVVLCGWAQPAQNRAAVEEWGARIKSYRKIVLASDWLEFHIYKYVAAYVCMSVRYVHGRRAIRGNVQI